MILEYKKKHFTYQTMKMKLQTRGSCNNNKQKKIKYSLVSVLFSEVCSNCEISID